MRLVMIAGPMNPTPPEFLAFTAFLAAERGGRSIWVPEVLRIYQVAARSNPILCQSLFAQMGDKPVGACGR